MPAFRPVVERASGLRRRVIPRLGGALLQAIMTTTRYQTVGPETFREFQRVGQPVIYVLWHGRLLPLTYGRRGEGVVALISRNRDGEYIARIVERWGFETVRGSSSRGGMAALRELVRKVREGKSIAITPDGPRGPREQMKPGALILAQLSGAPIIPAAASAERAWWFGRWDRFLIPQPFSRIRVAYGEPLFVPRQLGEAGLESYQAEVQARLNALMHQVDGH
jgi:lysophospholipid acyltransferase (LPLAT)-like uncharacterized protein